MDRVVGQERRVDRVDTHGAVRRRDARLVLDGVAVSLRLLEAVVLGDGGAYLLELRRQRAVAGERGPDRRDARN